MFMLVGMAMVMLVVAAGVALAITKTCGENAYPCNGTDNDDVLYERKGNDVRDRIYGHDGRDDMSAALYTNDEDKLFGQRHRDRIVVNDADSRDLADGGRGSDTCRIDNGDRTRSCARIDVAAAGLLPQGFGD